MAGYVKIIIIIVAALLLTAVIILGVIPSVKRSKLAEAWSKIALKAKLNFSTDYIKTELKKLSNQEVDTLISFSKALDAKQWTQVSAEILQVIKILNKTKLGSLETYAAAFLGSPIH